MSKTAIKEQVRARYASAIRQVQTKGDCCGPTEASGCCGGTAVAETAAPGGAHGSGYRPDDVAALPPGAVAASFGCGNPTALIDLHLGQTVLDLGSGGGIDVLLSARRVGPTGKAIGLDMTDQMLAAARRHADEAGVTNVEFRQGEIEAIPLPDASVDVVISNCVINLSPDKDAVLREAYRVLRPGGRFAVSDIVAQGAPVPTTLRADMASWTGCAGGALHEDEYRAKLRAAGFGAPEIVVTGGVEGDAGAASDCCGGDSGTGCGAAAYDGGRFVSAFVRAVKPAP